MHFRLVLHVSQCPSSAASNAVCNTLFHTVCMQYKRVPNCRDEVLTLMLHTALD